MTATRLRQRGLGTHRLRGGDAETQALRSVFGANTTGNPTPREAHHDLPEHRTPRRVHRVCRLPHVRGVPERYVAWQSRMPPRSPRVRVRATREPQAPLPTSGPPPRSLSNRWDG